MFQEAYKSVNEVADKFMLNSKNTFKQGWEYVEAYSTTTNKLGRTGLDLSKSMLEQNTNTMKELAKAENVSDFYKIQNKALSDNFSEMVKGMQTIYQTSAECWDDWRKLFQSRAEEESKSIRK